MIELDDIRKTRRGPDGDVTVLDGVDLIVDAAEIYGVVSEPAAGATALLRCVNLLERPDEGTVRVAGQELTAAGRGELRSARHAIGMLTDGLLDQRTIARNVGLPLEFAGIPPRERDLSVDEMLDLVGLAEHADDHPADLGAEERCRAALARALVAHPPVLLCDDVTADLPAATAQAILTLVRDLTAHLGVTVLMVSRTYPAIKAICDSVALLRDGRVVTHGKLRDLVSQPDSELFDALLPALPDAVPRAGGRPVADLTFVGGRADEPVLTEVARDCGVDLTVVAGGMETIAGHVVGRLRVELSGPGEDCQRALDRFADLELTPKVYR